MFLFGLDTFDVMEIILLNNASVRQDAINHTTLGV